MDLHRIRKIVEDKTELELTHKSRTTDYVYARAMFYKVCREYSLGTFETIGKVVNKNHATVLHGVKLFDNWISVNEPNYIEAYAEINKKVASLCKKEEQRFKSRDYYKKKFIGSLNLNRTLIKEKQQLQEILRTLNV